jgi:serine/threonine-protein phosphatase 2A regulatory subunit A
LLVITWAVVLTIASYRVPNIKFNVAKVLQSLIPIVDQSVVEKTIRPCLVELSEDPDVDVRFFATQALQSSDLVMMST